jgi:5-methylcytosine-specific restriction enzyme B
MGYGLYTSYWKEKIDAIYQHFRNGESKFIIEVAGIKQLDRRNAYNCRFIIDNGKLESDSSATAVGRDLYEVFVDSDFYKEKLLNKRIRFVITNKLQLRVEVNKEGIPDYFTSEDFEQLEKFAGIRKDDKNGEHSKTYKFLTNTYDKIRYWAEEVQSKLFPEGTVHIIRKPTNQASHFEEYQWAKIYPDNETSQYMSLAFTIGISINNDFEIKTDTVQVGEKDSRRQFYLMKRGDFENSPLVKLFSREDVLQEDWEYLIELSIKTIKRLLPEYFEIYKYITNGAQSDYYDNLGVYNMPFLNTILYGPPGTGKTFHTIDKAIQIIAPKLYDLYKDDREELTRIFRQHLICDWDNIEGQIAFITFHQSVSYEDFIEGIKPIIRPGDSTMVHYEIADGIFKRMCMEASRSSGYYVNIEGLKKPLTKDLFEEFYYAFSESLPLQSESSSPIILKTKEGNPFELFQNSVNSIVVKAGEKRTGQNVSFNELWSVLFENKSPTYKSYENIIIDKILEDKKFEESTIDNRNKKYVLIIDEINRGNVSGIFGELITLIEDTKRQSETEELTVMLPYSKKTFSIPKNIFIVGTMNTADRSVEALDTALRRRFVFEEKMSEPWKLSNNIDGIDLQQMLYKINERLQIILDRDHTIGHAWLIGCSSVKQLQAIFSEKIMPLLKEYFYNDYSKIGLILGKAFFKEIPKYDQKVFADFDRVDNETKRELAEKSIFQLRIPPDEELVLAFKSIYS